MKILVYGINYSPELTGIGKYTGEMVEWLAAQGHEVRVITAPPYYPQWQVGENYSAWRYKREEGAATVWRCPLYVPKQPSTLKRLLHLGSFAVSSFFPLMAQRRWKPDRIIGVVPTLFCTPGMRLLAKLSGARTVLHIQDYEVDAMLGLGLAGKGKGGKVAQLATAFELIADRNAVQDVKKVVEQIKADGRHEHRVHREVYRPWGKYDSIDAGDRYQVKRITVKPGEGLSVQMHHHRAEHWVVVAGTAKVTIDGDIKLLGENESIYIPLGATHCLENPGKIPLDLIEVRSGSYLEEDDVVRFADRYGRV
ncbi:WcaI family glycosyltransferase [Escherichia coli]|nr:WcaI family glycosyltransferase [Escherichia coli]